VILGDRRAAEITMLLRRAHSLPRSWRLRGEPAQPRDQLGAPARLLHLLERTHTATRMPPSASSGTGSSCSGSPPAAADGQRFYSWLRQHDARLVGRVDDSTYGLMEIYLVQRSADTR